MLQGTRDSETLWAYLVLNTDFFKLRNVISED